MGFEAAVGKLRSQGYKVTPQRVMVLESVSVEQHQSLHEIRARCPEVGLVTIYRTLDLLCEIGAVRRLDLGNGSRYELAADHHHHLICEECGTVAEFEECPIDVSTLPTPRDGFEISSHSLEVYGRCAGCR